MQSHMRDGKDHKGSSPVQGGIVNSAGLSRQRKATLATFVVIALVVSCTSLQILDATRLKDVWTAVKTRATPSSCPWTLQEAVPYPDPIARTALASFPRSGSSYTRSLIERATGFQTAALYCDVRLLKFKAECLGLDSPFLVKTHFPYRKSHDVDTSVQHWEHFERAIRIVRNPFDGIWSSYHFDNSGNHSARLRDVRSLSIEHHLPFLRDATEDWVHHARYWDEEADIPVHVVRYEDLRLRGLATLTALVDFLVPEAHKPSEERVKCAAKDDPSKDPYWSRKSPPFYAWHHYDHETRRWVLEAVKEIWCKDDFNSLFVESTGQPAPVDCASMTVLV